MNFTVYDKTTGVIIRFGICQDETFALQPTRPNEGVVEGQGDPRTQRVDPDTQQFVTLS